jgi:hypothetical protein
MPIDEPPAPEVPLEGLGVGVVPPNGVTAEPSSPPLEHARATPLDSKAIHRLAEARLRMSSG